MSTLLVDGDNLLTIGFHGLKNYFYKGQHIGGIYHFLNTLRRCFETYKLDKIVVLWDGVEGSSQRKKIYHRYKENRKTRIKSEEEINSYNYQRNRIKQYLEEIYVRQGEYDYCETDDAIAFYVHNSPNEQKIIYSSDGDLTQLVSQSTSLYNPSHQKLYHPRDTIVYRHEEILIENVKIAKIMCGDPSDDILGIRNLGIKRFLTIFPELRTDVVTIDMVRERTNQLFEENKNNNLINNLLTGVTKEGVLGDEFYTLNEQVVSLENPFLTDEAKHEVLSLVNDTLDPEGRSYKNTIKMMTQDGLFHVLPKREDAWTNFFNPFLRLTRKEKNKIIRTIKIKN